MPHTAVDPTLAKADIVEIKRMIPHRYPFLLIDRAFNIDPEGGAVGLKNVTNNEWFFEGHFPVEPVMPGVLIVEAMAQTATVFCSNKLQAAGSGMLVYFMTVDKCKFRAPVTPGDQLELHITVLRGRGKVWKFWGEGKVEGKTVAEAEFAAMIRPPEDTA